MACCAWCKSRQGTYGEVYVLHYPYGGEPANFSPTAWRRIRAKVESTLGRARERRLHERRSRERKYRSKAEQYYSDILRQVLPMQRLYLPAVSQAGELSCFRELLNPDRVANVQLGEWVLAAGQLPQSLSEWMSLHRDRYIGLLPFDSQGAHEKAMEIKRLSDPSTEGWRRAGTHDFAGKLELATSVFRHPDTNAIYIGRDICHAWKMKEELVYSERGAQAVRSLLQELYLDLETPASTLEQLGVRFICTCCPADLQRVHRSWRSCVSSRILYSVTNFDRNIRYRFLILSRVQRPIIHTLNGR